MTSNDTRQTLLCSCPSWSVAQGARRKAWHDCQQTDWWHCSYHLTKDAWYKFYVYIFMQKIFYLLNVRSLVWAVLCSYVNMSLFDLHAGMTSTATVWEVNATQLPGHLGKNSLYYNFTPVNPIMDMLMKAPGDQAVSSPWCSKSKEYQKW